MNIAHYKDWMTQPWGRVFYEILFAQLADVKDMAVLDFGSGLGVTATHLAKANQVTAIEPDEEMLANRFEKDGYTQLQGSLDKLRELPTASQDVIICHNVLEYVTPVDRSAIFQEFARILKQDGRLSLVKHHDVGKIVHKVVFEQGIDEAMELLEGGGSYQSTSFEAGQLYDVAEAMVAGFVVAKVQGLRCLYALQPNEVKGKSGWLEQMTELELAICDQSPYKDMAFFQHVWLRKD